MKDRAQKYYSSILVLSMLVPLFCGYVNIIKICVYTEWLNFFDLPNSKPALVSYQNLHFKPDSLQHDCIVWLFNINNCEKTRYNRALARKLM